jgi:hypothetical protein
MSARAIPFGLQLGIIIAASFIMAILAKVIGLTHSCWAAHGIRIRKNHGQFPFWDCRKITFTVEE